MTCLPWNWQTGVRNNYCLLFVPAPCPHKKGATDFFAVTFTKMLTDFHNFSCTTSQENAKVIVVKISCHTFVMLLPYRVKVSDTKVTHLTPILALAHVYNISITFTETSIDETNKTQNLCSKCPPFTRTHAFKRLRHCAIAAAMMVWSSSLHSLSRRSFNSFTSWIRER